MSGVYIKGMEMPKKGEYRCVVRTWGEEVTIDLYGDEELCGVIIPVPDHGRLIDADALLQEFYKAQKSYDAHGRPFSDAFMSGNEICAEWWAIEIKVEDAPTIIPAEEVEK